MVLMFAQFAHVSHVMSLVKSQTLHGNSPSHLGRHWHVETMQTVGMSLCDVGIYVSESLKV